VASSRNHARESVFAAFSIRFAACSCWDRPIRSAWPNSVTIAVCRHEVTGAGSRAVLIEATALCEAIQDGSLTVSVRSMPTRSLPSTHA
jgi:hypothetical protein